MAAYTVAAGKLAVHAKLLVAATADSVTFDAGDDVRQVEVYSDGAAELYFTVDGSAPTVGGAHTYHLPAAAASRSVPVPDVDPTVVKLISAGAPTYHVTRV